MPQCFHFAVHAFAYNFEQIAGRGLEFIKNAVKFLIQRRASYILRRPGKTLLVYFPKRVQAPVHLIEQGKIGGHFKRLDMVSMHESAIFKYTEMRLDFRQLLINGPEGNRGVAAQQFFNPQMDVIDFRNNNMRYIKLWGVELFQVMHTPEAVVHHAYEGSRYNEYGQHRGGNGMLGLPRAVRRASVLQPGRDTWCAVR